MFIQNTYELHILINGLDITAAPGCMLDHAIIHEDISDLIPTCELHFIVPNAIVDNESFVDGSLIEILLEAADLDFKELLVFRLYQADFRLDQDFCNVSVFGFLDFYDGYRYNSTFNIYGSTSDVFNKIADFYKLERSIDNTNDTQLWVAGEGNLYKYLNTMSQYGWVDETSGMFWCMDRHKILLYKNITSLFRNSSKNIWSFLQIQEPSTKEKIFSYETATTVIKAGEENLTHEGYGGDDHYFNLTDYSWKTAVSKRVVAESNILNINKDLSQGLAESWYPFDVGNFHPNYYNAKKQNKRVLSTFSTFVELKSQFFMNYRIGQIVNFVYMDGRDIKNRIGLTSGKYMIKGIEINITPDSITSSLVLVMQGLNGKTSLQNTY